MNESFTTTLEYIDSDADCHQFRIAFDSSTDRLLLPYPDVTGLRFTSPGVEEVSEWKTGFLVAEPLDEFVLRPGDRIAFDLRAYVNVKSTPGERRWVIDLSPGEFDVQYIYSVDPKTRRYDYLNRESRFADMTKPWSGEVSSNLVRFVLPPIGLLHA